MNNELAYINKTLECIEDDLGYIGGIEDRLDDIHDDLRELITSIEYLTDKIGEKNEQPNYRKIKR